MARQVPADGKLPPDEGAEELRVALSASAATKERRISPVWQHNMEE